MDLSKLTIEQLHKLKDDVYVAIRDYKPQKVKKSIDLKGIKCI